MSALAEPAQEKTAQAGELFGHPRGLSYLFATEITHYLSDHQPTDEHLVPEWNAHRAGYRALLDHPAWHEVALAALAEGEPRMQWIAEAVAPELGLVFVLES